MRIDKYGISLRFVEEQDAEFIIALRTDEKLSRFLSPTSSDIKAQKEWTRQYKQREKEGKEFYFIAMYQGKAYGTTRIYNIEPECFEVGSWLFAPDTPNGVAVLADIIGREFAFEKLCVDKCKFEVRRNNVSVLKYHKGYKPILVNETPQDYFFTLDKRSFEEHKNKLIKILAK